MDQGRKLYRSRDVLVGGVCNGVAQYLDTDTIVIRILCVALSLFTFGLGALVYLLMWAVLPLEPEEKTLAAQVDKALSATFGEFDVTDVSLTSKSFSAEERAELYEVVGNLPPQPPVGIPAAKTVPQPPQPSACRAARERNVTCALWIGALLLFAGISWAIYHAVSGVEWWQFYPLVFIIIGLLCMVLPMELLRQPAVFYIGTLIVCVGFGLLPMTLGVLSFETIPNAACKLWWLLAAMVGFFVAGAIKKSRACAFVGCLCFAAFCFFAVLYCGVPGETENILINLPFTRRFVLEFTTG